LVVPPFDETRHRRLGSVTPVEHCDAELLREMIPELAQKLLPTARGKDAKALQGLIAVDGSLLPALPKMIWALWIDDDHRAAKMHVHFDVFKGIPADVTVTPSTQDVNPDHLRRSGRRRLPSPRTSSSHDLSIEHLSGRTVLTLPHKAAIFWRRFI
jgi:hypothetical protein